jgi:hypothetical protein
MLASPGRHFQSMIVRCTAAAMPPSGLLNHLFGAAASWSAGTDGLARRATHTREVHKKSLAPGEACCLLERLTVERAGCYTSLRRTAHTAA